MESLGHYRIESQLGQGAMGVVYRAVDERLERTVALKVLRLNLSPEERAEYAPRLQQEAKSAARLNHPNIITVYDYGDIDGYAFLAIEFVEGKTLQSLLESGVKISPNRLVKLAAQLFGALAYAHEHDVVHRDIKPANLMLTADGRLKITDFGIAQLPTSDLTRAGTIVGSPRYMAPEQLEGKKLDGRADIFAAGIVLYEVLTGKRPFDGDHVATIAYRILHEAPTDIRSLNPEVPEWLVDVVMRCLEKDPAKRFQTAREARSALREQAGSASASIISPPTATAEPTADVASKAAAKDTNGANTNTNSSRLLLWIGVGVGGALSALALATWLMKPKSATLQIAAPVAQQVPVEVMEPPGAPGSLPAKAAMPIQAAAPTDNGASPPAEPKPVSASAPEVKKPEGTTTPTKEAVSDPVPLPTKKVVPPKPKPKPVENGATPQEPSHTGAGEHREGTKAAADKRPDAANAEEDKRSLIERLAGCAADGTCPEPKRPPKRER